MIETAERKVKVKLLLFGGGAGHIGETLAGELTNLSQQRAVCEIYALNTDKEDLSALIQSQPSINAIQIGKEETDGYGAGHEPSIGRAAAEESRSEIEAIIKDVDICIFVACLGGGTGTGSLPYVAEMFKKEMDSQKDMKLHQKKAGIVIVTMPFSSQSRTVSENATSAYYALNQIGLPIMRIENDKFLPESDELTAMPLSGMFLLGNKPMAHAIGRMIRSLGSRHDHMNIDRNDIVGNLLLDGGQSVMSYYGVGYCKEGEDLKVALEMAAINPFLDTKLSESHQAVISIDCNNATIRDQIAIDTFCNGYRVHRNASWRHGINLNYQPLPFEENGEYRAAVFAIGLGCVPPSEIDEYDVVDEVQVSESSYSIDAVAIPYEPTPQTLNHGTGETPEGLIEKVHEEQEKRYQSVIGKM